MQYLRSGIIVWGVLITVLLAAVSSLGQGSRGHASMSPGRNAEKVSGLLLEEVRALSANPEYDYPIPVIVRLNRDLFVDLNARGSSADNSLRLIHAYAARLRAADIRRLLDSEGVEYITWDAPIHLNADLSIDNSLTSIGAKDLQASGVVGQGVVMALFDSGIGDHPGLSGRRKVASVDFTKGQPLLTDRNRDEYGHGTAVAGVAGGWMQPAGYAGVAPGIRFLDVKVIDSTGSGSTSNLIKAIDWVVTNRSLYRVRVANLSLGHPPLESHRKDPLCQAVERMTQAGIVTVVSAGNLGKTSKGEKIWGGISSPGTSPAVVTVGALNSRDQVRPSSFVATSFSSRGPSYPDLIFKPDLSAPGNRVLVLQESSSWIWRNHPELRVGDQFITLSGSSLAAPFVSGTVALMLEANPNLTPKIVKAILVVSAVKLPNPHLLEQGNGLVNSQVATRLASALDMRGRGLTKRVVSTWFLGDERIAAGGAFGFGKGVVYTQGVPSSGVGDIWGGGISWSGPSEFGNGPGSFFASTSPVWSDRWNWDDGSFLCPPGASCQDGIVWFEDLLSAEGVLWLDGTFEGDGLIWQDSTFAAEGIVWLDNVFTAD